MQSNIQNLIKTGIEQFQNRNFDLAQNSFKQALQIDPGNTDALHILGVIAAQKGDFSSAQTHLEKVLSIAPESPIFLNSYGNILFASNLIDKAKHIYFEAIKSNPSYPESYYNLGVLFLEGKSFFDAFSNFQKAIELNPNYAEAFCNLGIIHKNWGNFMNALYCFEKAIQIAPKLYQAYSNKGNIHFLLKEYQLALVDYTNALNLNPQYFEALNNLGNVYKALKNDPLALRCYDGAIQINPNYIDGYYNKGLLLGDLGQLSESIYCYKQVLSMDPNHINALNNCGFNFYKLGNYKLAIQFIDQAISLKPDEINCYLNRGTILSEMRYLNEALHDYEMGLKIDPKNPKFLFNKSLILLLKGNLSEGFSLYESRLELEHFKASNINVTGITRWNGQESLFGKTILITSEQGLGDSLQFIRYVKPLKLLGATIHVQVEQALIEIFQKISEIDIVLKKNDSVKNVDFYIPMMSLPHAFKSTYETIPKLIPYIEPDQEKSAYWSKKLLNYASPKIGLVWSGGFRANQPELSNVNARRNIPLNYFSILKGLDATFISLQKGEPAESEFKEIQSSNWCGPNIINLISECDNFSDTAALIENLDLVISVDTSVAHLTGALGIPVWILNRFDGCWRWQIDQNSTPWYPSARIFNQKVMGNWEDVLREVRLELIKWLLNQTKDN
jgi:tetratricopeptide (TPR) repeat protein